MSLTGRVKNPRSAGYFAADDSTNTEELALAVNIRWQATMASKMPSKGQVIQAGVASEPAPGG
jgi:hypothetical protein